MLSSSGQAQTIFGTLAVTQNATTNAEGSIGTNLVCANPQDLLIQGDWLYMTCYGMSAIKKMGINPAVSATYLKGYMVVGYLNATSTVVAGNSDGSIGITGIARANGPTGLAADGDGNIYWTDYATSRARMLNLSVSNKTFFPSRSISANFNIGMADLSATALTAPTALVTKAETSSTVPNTLYPWGPSTIATNTCVHYRVQSRAGTVPSKAQSIITVNLSQSTGTIYSDSGCTTSTTTVQIPIGSAEADFYYKRAAGTGAVTLTISGLTGTPTIPVTVTNAGGTATKLVAYGPSSFEYSTCTKMMLQVMDASSLPTTSSTTRTVLLADDNTGNFYSDSACSTTPINSVTLTASVTREAYIYFAKTTIAPAGHVVSLFGNNNSQLYAAGGASSLTVRFPRDILVDYTNSTINGFFVDTNNNATVDTHHRIVYVNNTTSNQTIGGTLLNAYNQGAIAGANHGGAAVAGTSSSGFNGDDTRGNLAMIFHPWGLSFDSTKSRVLFGDNLNYRLRALDISISSGNVTTLLGNGYLRNGTIGLDSLTPATNAFLNSPSKVVIDNSTRTMYISDTGNGRIRKVDMLTGYVDRALGSGIGSANTESADPTNVLNRSIRGITLATSGTNRFLIYTDNEAAAPAANKTCLVRALNLGGSTASIFGVSIAANRISTVAGDYTQGCGPFSTNGSGAGVSRYLNWPEDVAFDGTNLYVVVNNDHCILKLDSTGYMSPIMGSCGTAGGVDGYTPNTGSIATSRFPMGIAPDLDNIGNFFIGDQVDQNTGKIRYVNTSTNSINVGGSIAQGIVAGNASKTTLLWNLIPTGGLASRINSLAAFGNIVCWAAGAIGDGNTGPHAIYCADKTTGTVSRKAGPNEQSSDYFHGGAPLGSEQENIPGVGALLAAPYGLTFDSEGNLYIVERSAHTVRMLRRWF